MQETKESRDLRRQERRGRERKEDEIFARTNLRAEVDVEETKYEEKVEYMKVNQKNEIRQIFGGIQLGEEGKEK